MIVLTIKSLGGFNAGPKAPNDISQILEEKYNAKNEYLVQNDSILAKIKYRCKIFSTIIKSRIKKEILVMQFPMYETTTLLNKLFLLALNLINKEKTIILIHDLDSLRSEEEILKKQEYDRLSKVKYIIVHNDKMKKYLEEIGIKAKLYSLELFDYICDKKQDFERSQTDIDNKKLEVIYAGNLKKDKSPYIYQLKQENMNFKINLYGVGIDKNINEKLIYKGKFPPNELPDKIQGTLGLIWDGNFDESDENIKFKYYTKYNNPHKLSCYIAAGIPVIVWRKAAIADFVEKHNIGYIISNIYDINKIDLSNYIEKIENVKEIQKKVRNGEFTKEVFDKILLDMEETHE